uniref:Uncharacterized protein n=1 Tax=Crocodylus porosus TaxID=8502 RepID=A0A7M4F3Q6_CROPO
SNQFSHSWFLALPLISIPLHSVFAFPDSAPYPATLEIFQLSTYPLKTCLNTNLYFEPCEFPHLRGPSTHGAWSCCCQGGSGHSFQWQQEQAYHIDKKHHKKSTGLQPHLH